MVITTRFISLAIIAADYHKHPGHGACVKEACVCLNQERRVEGNAYFVSDAKRESGLGGS